MHPALDPARWAMLSPRLDELLDLDAPARAARLAEWRGTDPHLAAELEALLTTVPAVQSERFLEDGVRETLAAPGAGAGSVCGAWTLDSVLGSGGMGSVWLARRTDGRYQAKAAIKLPHPAVLVYGGAERFEREGRLLARVSHPHIAGLLDAGVAPSGQPYLVLEYVQGEPIDAWCDRQRLSAGARIDLFLDVLAAVAHAHAQLVLHRDLKSSNILVDASGGVKLLDFGIAKLIEADPASAGADGPGNTVRAFTPDNVAPEQLQGQPVGTSTDVYALGVLLYQLLAGRHPTAMAAHSPVERLRAVVETEPLPMSDAASQAGSESSALRAATPRQLARLLHGDLDTIVAKALKKNLAERYAGAAAFADDLRRWRDGHPVLARPDRPGHRLQLFVRRNRLAVGAAAMGVVLLLGGAAATGWQATVASRERDEARFQADRAQARAQLYDLMLGQMGRLDAPLTQRQILDSAVKLIESRFGSKPRVAVGLLLPIAGQYGTMGDVQADLAVMQLASRLAQASGEAKLIAETACSTVDTYIALNRMADAEAAIATAQAAIARAPDEAGMALPVCWRYEAELAYRQGQAGRALAISLRALKRLESDRDTSRSVYRALLSLLAYVYRENGDQASAFATVERLAAIHRALSGGHSLDAAAADQIRAHLLADAGEIGAALELAQELVTRFVRSGAAASPNLLLSLAHLELISGRTVDARANVALAEAAARKLASHEFDARLVYARFLAALADANVAEAQRWLETFEPLRGHPRLLTATPTPGAARARYLLAQGQTAAAVEAIEAELARLEKAEVGNLERRADAWRSAAQIHLSAGDPARAASRAQLALAASTRAARDPEASAHVGHARLLLARSRQAAGDGAGAREEAARAAGSLTRGLGAEHRLAVEARTLADTP